MSELLTLEKEAEGCASNALKSVDWGILLNGSKSEQSEFLFYFAWNAFEHGWNKSKESNDAAVKLMSDDLYRKGVITSFDGFAFTHGGTTWVNLTNSEGEKSDFNLRNLPDYNRLEEFKSLATALRSDEDLYAISDQSPALKQAIHLIGATIEKIYWRKVARSLKSYHDQSNLKIKAIESLLSAGFSQDEVDRLIESPSIQHD